MYREEILDHYKNPRNQGTLENALVAEGENPSCGDHCHIYIQTSNGKINTLRHETDGCAISTASVSVLSEEIQGMRLEEVKDLDSDWMLEKLGIEVSPMRVKCALLGIKTAQKAINL